MRMMPCAPIAICLIALTAAQAETGPLTGRFQGTGRSCYGTLAVQEKTISWMTPFSQCKAIAYALVEQGKQAGQILVTYRFKSHPAGCRYAILSLTHRGTADDTGWEVTGYGSEQSYRVDKASGYKTRTADMMSCPLIRGQEK